MLGHLNQSVCHELLEQGRAALFRPLMARRAITAAERVMLEGERPSG